MGQPKAQYIYDLAQALKAVITPVLDETLIVVSCNLSSNTNKEEALHLAEEALHLFCEKNSPALAGAILDGRLNACGGALAAGLFESGLLDKTYSCSMADKMLSAVSAENTTVFYSELSYF